MAIIVIDPGHGGDQPGALGYRNTYDREPDGPFISPTEAELNLMFSHRLAATLSQHGHTIELTRVSDDETVGLTTRCTTANNKNADLFISIHHNSAEAIQANGFEVLFHPGSDAEVLAYQMNKAVAIEFAERMKPRGAKPRNDLYVLKHTQMPAVLIEVGFMSNDKEEVMLNLPDFQDEMSRVLAGVTDYWLRELC